MWLLLLKCPRKLAFWGGFLHAVALSAIARSTGQDLVRGEFCIPLITLAFVLAAWCNARARWWKAPIIFAVVFLAFIAWDLCQMTQLENSMDRGAWRATVHGVTKAWDTTAHRQKTYLVT